MRKGKAAQAVLYDGEEADARIPRCCSHNTGGPARAGGYAALFQ